MDNLVNSLVTKTIGLTDQQVKDKLLASPNMNDSQMVQFMRTNGVSPSQMSKANGMPEGQIASKVATTLSPNQPVLLGDTWVQSNYQTIGSGEDQQIGPLESIAVYKTPGGVNDKIPVGTDVQSYSPNGDFVGTTQTKKVDTSLGGVIKDITSNPGFKILLAAYGANALGMFGGAATGAGSAFELANAGAGAFEGGTALNTLAGTGAGSAFEAANAGATAMSDLGAAELANAGASANTVGGTTLANAAGNTAGSTLAKTAGSALGTTLGQGLGLNALGNVAGTIANQSGINNARDLISQYGNTANTQLNTAYNDAKGLNTANNTSLANLYTNFSGSLRSNLNDQIGAYNTANTGIKSNAATELALLKSNLANQTTQANANATGLKSNYDTTLSNMGKVYNEQVGYQQPYQDVGAAGSKGLIDNQDYLTRQFGASDLNEQLAPNYAFQLAQGQMANQRAANMGGGSMGGNALQGLQKYTQDYASGAYQNAFNNFNTQRQNIYSTLAGMANIGTTSGGQLASLGNTYGTNMGGLSSNLGGNLTTNTGNLLNAGNVYGSNTAGVTNNLNNVLSSNLGQLQGAYNQYGSNLTGAVNSYGSNLTAGTGQAMNASNLYGANSANLATGIGSALAGNATATGANTATGLNNLGNLAFLGSMLKAS